jgi:dihydrofolate reductase
MKGGTTFHFVTDGIDAAVERATDAAGGKDVNVAGGADALEPTRLVASPAVAHFRSRRTG